VPTLKAIKTVKVGRFPWGAAIRPVVATGEAAAK
jgi:hypothetical protein